MEVMVQQTRTLPMARRAYMHACLFVVACLVGSGCGGNGGVHARMGFSEAGGLRVVDVPAGPAYRAGLREDDQIIAIDDDPVARMTMVEVVERLRGRVGSVVKLRVARGDDVRELSIERASYRDRRPRSDR